MGKIKKMKTIRGIESYELTNKDSKINNKKTSIIDITPINVFLSGPSGKVPKNIKKEDVWGKWDLKHNIKIKEGMIVSETNEKCTIFKDIVPYKSVTIICNKDQTEEVIYWLEYVQGANCVTKKKELDNYKVALRSDYQCW